MRSIRQRLLLWLLVGLALVLAVSGYATYRQARAEINALFDYQLKQTALALRNQNLLTLAMSADPSEGESDLLVQIWDRNRGLLYVSRSSRELPFATQQGFTDLLWRNESWRLFALNVGDRILIGSQELTLLSARDALASAGIGVGKMTLPKMKVSTPSSGFPAMGQIESDPEPSMVRRADQFKLLSGVAEKALAMGKAGEAERLLASALADVIEATRAGRPLPPTLVDQAAKFSAKLATATGKGGWADYVIELYQAQKRPCPAHVIDELYNAMRKVTAVDMHRLRTYVAMLRQNLPRYGPAERFLFQRLEGLERLAALR